MAKEFPPDELADRTFIISVVGIAVLCAVVFLFILF